VPPDLRKVPCVRRCLCEYQIRAVVASVVNFLLFVAAPDVVMEQLRRKCDLV
jgi:hypothetical protein